jgi:hypothetical protein
MSLHGRPRADFVGGAGWIAAGLAIAVASWRMDRFEQMGATIYTMPGLVPGIVGAVLMLLGAALMLRAWRSARRGAEAGPAPEPLWNARVLQMLLLCVAYAGGLVGRAPFTLSTALFTAAAVAWFAPRDDAPLRRYGLALAAGVGTAVAIELVFERIFLVRLP